MARDENLKEQIGKDIYFDLVDHEKVRSFRIQKQLPFTTFKVRCANKFLVHSIGMLNFCYTSTHASVKSTGNLTSVE